MFDEMTDTVKKMNRVNEMISRSYEDIGTSVAYMLGARFKEKAEGLFLDIVYMSDGNPMKIRDVEEDYETELTALDKEIFESLTEAEDHYRKAKELLFRALDLHEEEKREERALEG